MEDLTELYQEIILSHHRNPRHDEVLDPCSHQASGFNPLCGDRLVVTVRKQDATLDAVACHCEGCAISRASGSIMTTMTTGKSEAEVAETIAHVKQLLTAEEDPQADLDSEGELAALVGVRKFPARIKCATLAWHALESALVEGDAEATTE
jgi:nitrogen fixation NifU-like protein